MPPAPSSKITSIDVNTCLINASIGTFDSVICTSGSFSNITITNACIVSVSYVTLTSVSQQYMFGEIDAHNVSCLDLNASLAVFTNASLQFLNGLSSSTLACLSNVSADIQQQLNTLHTQLTSTTSTSILNTSTINASYFNTISASTLQCLSTVSSNIQSQLDNVSTAVIQVQNGAVLLHNTSIVNGSINSASISVLNVSYVNTISASTLQCIGTVSSDVQTQLNNITAGKTLLSNTSIVSGSIQNTYIGTASIASASISLLNCSAIMSRCNVYNDCSGLSSSNNQFTIAGQTNKNCKIRFCVDTNACVAYMSSVNEYQAYMPLCINTEGATGNPQNTYIGNTNSYVSVPNLSSIQASITNISTTTLNGMSASWLSTVSGVTSNIQTQLNNIVSGTTTINGGNLSMNSASFNSLYVTLLNSSIENCSSLNMYATNACITNMYSTMFLGNSLSFVNACFNSLVTASLSLDTLHVNNLCFTNTASFAVNSLIANSLSFTNSASWQIGSLVVSNLSFTNNASFSFASLIFANNVSSLSASISTINTSYINSISSSTLNCIATLSSDIQTQVNLLNSCTQNISLNYWNTNSSLRGIVSGSNASFVNVCITNASIVYLYAPTVSFSSVSLASLNRISASTLACINTVSSDIQSQVNSVSLLTASLRTGGVVLSNVSITTSSLTSVSITTLNVSTLNGLSSSTLACLSNVSYDIQSQLTNLSCTNCSALNAFIHNACITTSCNVLCDCVVNGSLNVCGNLYANHGYFTNFVTVGYSDDRMKTRLNPLNNCLDKLLSLNMFQYLPQTWVCEQLGVDNTLHVGLSAQEVREVFPEVIAPLKISKQGEHEDDYMTIRYEHFVPILIQCIRELKDLITNH